MTSPPSSRLEKKPCSTGWRQRWASRLPATSYSPRRTSRRTTRTKANPKRKWSRNRHRRVSRTSLGEVSRSSDRDTCHLDVEVECTMAKKKASKSPKYDEFKHPEATSPMRPDVGTQAAFKKKKPPVTYRYDSSLSPAFDWDGQNPAREEGEAVLARLREQLGELRAALELPGLDAALRDRLAASASQCVGLIDQLKAMSRPFLNWAGKAERFSFDVPSLPLFVHERLSTKAIVTTLRGHKRDQLTRAYEYQDGWVNRMILGDSLVVMNSLLHFENLGGQVQMIYMDPPYGVKYGSNFQPFVRRRDVKHGDDEDLTREPEMVQAYRDTWELGLHSYLTYLRDRLLLIRNLLHSTGSVFLQISDENVHHARELLDEVFGSRNFVSLITFKKTSSASGSLLSSVSDYLLWYAKDIERLKYEQLYSEKSAGEAGGTQYTWAEHPDGTRLNYGSFERLEAEAPKGSRVFRHDNLTSQRPSQGADVRSFNFEGRTFTPGKGTFKTDSEGLESLAKNKRLIAVGNTLSYVRFLDDFPVFPTANLWVDTVSSGFAAQKLYVVQTNPTAIQRCILMTTSPGDLVLDPTCGSGTTAHVAEQWGRRWITIDTSRVPLALARQRLLTATFLYYKLKER